MHLVKEHVHVLPLTQRRGAAYRRLAAAGAALTIVLLLIVAALAANGDLDLRFGVNGIVSTEFPNAPAAVSAVTIQADGKIIAVGVSDGDFAVTRYNVDGSLDTRFSGDGRVRTRLPSDDGTSAVVVQGNGKIVVVGRIDLDFGVIRYNPNGSRDQHFGTAGVVTTDFSGDTDAAAAVALQRDGLEERIVVVGGTFGDIKLARYLDDGSLDASFGTGGRVVTQAGRDETAHAVAVQPDGKIVVAGQALGPTSSRSDFMLVRFNSDGTLDEGFGTGGVVFTDHGGRIDGANALVIQPDGKIIAAGFAGADRLFTPSDFALARYNEDGTLDSAFGVGGKVRTIVAPPGVPDASSRVTGLARQVDGKIVAVGQAQPVTLAPSEIVLVQYNSDGTLDTTFGGGGVVITDLGGQNQTALSVAVQPDGKIVMATDVGGTAFVLTRHVYESARGPFGGTPQAIPGRIEAEDYDLGGQGYGYFDTTVGHEDAFVYRTDDVDLKASREGGHTIGWFAAGEWLNYTVDVQTTGSYRLRARVGSFFPGRTFSVTVDGDDVTGPIAVPQVRDWDRYRTVQIAGVPLTSGRHTVRVLMGPLDFMD